MRYVVYDTSGDILRTGGCPKSAFPLQASQPDEFVMEGKADDSKHKIVNGEVVNRTTDEIEASKPKKIKYEKQPARITNEQLQSILDRLTALEK